MKVFELIQVLSRYAAGAEVSVIMFPKGLDEGREGEDAGITEIKNCFGDVHIFADAAAAKPEQRTFSWKLKEAERILKTERDRDQRRSAKRHRGWELRNGLSEPRPEPIPLPDFEG